MIANLEVRENGQLWLRLENDRAAEVELQAIDVALSHRGQSFEGEVLPYKKFFAPGEQTSLSLGKFVGMHLQLQRAQPGAAVEVTCRLLAFAEDPADAAAAPASLTVHWNADQFTAGG